jgi:hypothetical protein
MPTTNNHKPIKATTSYLRWSIIVVVVLASGILVRSFFKNKDAGTHNASAQVAMKIEQVAVEKEQEPTEANSEIAGKYYGLCAKSSVHSVKDFRSTVEKDPVLASHFEGFDWQTAHLGKQDTEVWTYVTYRKDKIIGRTSKPVKLPQGDEYITDGTRMVRTFCCNDYVAAPPPGKTSPGPSERVDGPPRRITDPFSKIATQGPPITALLNELPPPVDKSLEAFPTNYRPTVYGGGGGGGSTVYGIYSTGTKPSPPTTTVVPEPSTIILLCAGITAIVLLRSKANKLRARAIKVARDFDH